MNQTGIPASRASLLELIIETAPDAIITADEQGVILSFSPAAEHMFGFSESEIIGQNLKTLMPEPHRSEHDGYIARHLETGENRIIGIGREVRAQRKSGDIFVAELAVGELRLGEQRVFTGFIRDVSDRAIAETRARDLQIRLDRVARMQMLGEMSTALAHEINQPLAAVTNFAQAAKRSLDAESPDLEAIAKYVAAVEEQSMRAGEIIRRMRKLIDRGKAEIKPDDINDIISEAVRVSRISSAGTGPEVHLDLSPDLPKVLADRIQIQQVLLNLMRNAYEAVETGEHSLTIESEMADRIVLSAGVADDEVVISVLDTGPGIPEEVLHRVFEPLISTKPSGLGVGLAVCRTIVHAHKGRIWAENTDQGAIFRFTLPTVREGTE